MFEVGKSYGAADSSIDPITILRRTAHTVKVRNTSSEWHMRVWVDEEGFECVTDSVVPERWRHAFTWSSRWEV